MSSRGGLTGRLPWIELGEWPTPVRSLGGLAAGLELGALWVKQDDLSGRRCGGNKVRKLELLLGEAQARGSQSVVSVGGIGSNHLVATACYARQLGLSTHGVVFAQPVTPEVRRTLRVLQSLEVELWPCGSRLGVPAALWRARRQAERPYLIPAGGSSPLGCLGYVSAALELDEQVQRGELPEPDIILLALGSGGTSAGLALGLELCGLRSELWAVRVVERPLCNSVLLRWLISRTARRLRALGIPVSAGRAARRVTLIHDQLGAGYGWATSAAEEAIRAATGEGLALETTYTGKAFAALLARSGAARGRRILFWNSHNSRDLSHLTSGQGGRPLPPAMAHWVDGG